jgi:hypothetical protein
MVSVILDIITTAAILFIVSSGLLLVFGVMKLVKFTPQDYLSLKMTTSISRRRTPILQNAPQQFNAPPTSTNRTTR